MGEENVRTYCIVLLCSLSAGCACVFHLVLASCVWMVWYCLVSFGMGGRLCREMLMCKMLIRMLFCWIWTTWEREEKRRRIQKPTELDLGDSSEKLRLKGTLSTQTDDHSRNLPTRQSARLDLDRRKRREIEFEL
jgi:hypothetical protein